MKTLIILLTTLLISEVTHANVFPELVKINMSKKDLVFSVFMGKSILKELNEKELELLELARQNDPDAIDTMFIKARELELRDSGRDLNEKLSETEDKKQPHSVFPELIKIRMSKKDLVFSVFMGESILKELNGEELELLELARQNDPDAIDTMLIKARELRLQENGTDILNWLH